MIAFLFVLHFITFALASSFLEYMYVILAYTLLV